MVPVACRTHFHGVDGEFLPAGGELCADFRDFGGRAGAPGAPSEDVAEDPIRHAHGACADRTRTRGVHAVMGGGGAQQEVRVADLVALESAFPKIAQVRRPFPRVGDRVLGSNSGNHGTQPNPRFPTQGFNDPVSPSPHFCRIPR